MTPPHYLQSQYINPASLVELQVLDQVATGMQQQGNVKGSIPYLAKICQIVDNQHTDNKTALDQIRAQAHAQLADAYFKAQQFIQCEASLNLAIKIWEKATKTKIPETTTIDYLLSAYDQLIECYEVLGKSKMIEYIKQRKTKLTTTTSSLQAPSSS